MGLDQNNSESVGATRCDYIFRDELRNTGKDRQCDKPVYLDRKCTLHADLPEDTGSQEFKEVNLDKQRLVVEKLRKNDFSFEGARLSSFNLAELIDTESIEGSLDFTDAFIRGDVEIHSNVSRFVTFTGATIKGSGKFFGLRAGQSELPIFSVLFDGATIDGDVWFNETHIGGSVRFDGAYVGGFASFDGAEINGHISFQKAGEKRATVGRDVSFDGGSKIRGDIRFDDSEIRGNVSFDETNARYISFDHADIGGLARFETVRTTSGLSFGDTEFSNPVEQERACRKAKQEWEDLGDRDQADYHFYREMVAKRLRKPQRARIGEWLFIQFPLKYGTSSGRLVQVWFLTGLTLGVALAYESGNWSSLLSWTAAIFAPGYALAQISGSNLFVEVLAVIETILGAFFWGAFILVFSRRYMR